MHLFIYACTWVKGRRASLYLFPTLILWMKLQTNWKLEVKLSLESDFKEIFQSTDNTTKALTENHWKMIHSMCLREIWQVNHLASAHIIRNFGAIALSYPPPSPPPIVIDDSSWKNAAESFTASPNPNPRGYESANSAETLTEKF